MQPLRNLVGIGLIACLPACSGHPSAAAAPTSSRASAATPTVTVTESPPISLTTAPASRLPSVAPSQPTVRCATSALRATIKPVPDGAGGHDAETVILTNVSTLKCTLDGYPGLGFLDHSGHPFPVTVQRGAQGYLSGIKDPGPSLVTLIPNASASATITYSGNGPAPCQSTSAVQVTPPDSFTSSRVSTFFIACRSLDITAVVAGTSGVAGGKP